MPTADSFTLQTQTRINIRPATLDDIDALVPLVERYRTTLEKKSDPQAVRNFISDRIRYNQTLIFLGFCNDTLCGMLQVSPIYCYRALRIQWMLDNLYVLPEYEKFPVKLQLVKAAKRHADQRGASWMFSFISHDDQPLKDVLIRQFGFNLDHDHGFYYGPV
jgi:N-acetylglutamate synthase-like GNAT family acetyltransferase